MTLLGVLFTLFKLTNWAQYLKSKAWRALNPAIKWDQLLLKEFILILSISNKILTILCL